MILDRIQDFTCLHLILCHSSQLESALCVLEATELIVLIHKMLSFYGPEQLIPFSKDAAKFYYFSQENGNWS